MVKQAKVLTKKFEAFQIQYVAHMRNKEGDLLAKKQFEIHICAIKLQDTKFQGQEELEDILFFLQIGECPKAWEEFTNIGW